MSVRYKLFVGVSYHIRGEQILECNPEDVVALVKIIQDLLLDEKDAQKFLFNVEVIEEEEKDGVQNMVGGKPT